MNFNKKKGISAVAVIILLAVFNVVAFLLPVPHSITFWLGYSFATLSGVLLLACLLFLFDADDNSRTFLRLPIAKLGWAYFVLQMGAGVWQILNFAVPYLPALIVNCVLTGLFIIILLASQAAGESIEKQDARVAEKVLFLKNIQAILSTIKTSDTELSNKIEALKEDVRFSDPMSHSMLSELEKQIEAKVIMLKSEAKDSKTALVSVDCISDLLKERNQKCKMLKNVKEEKKPGDNSGVKYVAITIGILGVLATIALVVCFVVIPNNIYNTATKLYEAEKYAEAKVVFESLDGFSDSKEMAEACDTAVKEKKYTEAAKLFEDKKYDEAIAAYEELGTYKDSIQLIESAKQKIIEGKYELAEKHFAYQNYVEAIKLYTELGDYEDCKQKIEQINNRLAKDDVLYFGTYKDATIAWQVVKTENRKMLLIAKDPVCELPYHNEIKNILWKDSTLCEWLNNDFLASFSEDQRADILTTTVDGVDMQVYLMSRREADRLDNKELLKSGKDWWLRTDTIAEAIYVTKDGNIEKGGDSVVRAKGVRPCIWIDLT